jgi:hypothetical protein
MVFNGVDNVSSVISQINKKLEESEKRANELSQNLIGVESAFMLFDRAKMAVGGLVENMQGLVGEYQHELEMETRLSTVMRARFGANGEMIQGMKDTLNAMEASTGYTYETLTNGAQELATYIEDADTLKGLLPILANMARQGGVNSEQGMMSYATMLGKVMGGDMGGMSKRGYVFSDAEKQAFKLMSEQERLAFLTDTVTKSIGDQANALSAINTQSVESLNIQLGNTRKALGKTLKPLLDFYKIIVTKWQIKFIENINKALQFAEKHIKAVIVAMTALSAIIISVGIAYTVMAIKAKLAGYESAKAALMAAAGWIKAHLAIFGIVTAVVALITILGVLIFKYLPQITGFFYGIGGVAEEVGLVIKNAFGKAIEFTVNGFVKFKNKIIDVFIVVFDTLLSGIEKIAVGMDTVFQTNLADGIKGFRASVKSLKNDNIEEFSLGWSDNTKGFDNAWRENYFKGMSAGATAKNKLEAEFEKIKNKLGINKNGEMEMPTAETMGFDLDENGALKTAEQNSLKIDDEFKRLLSEQALKDYQIRYSQITPSVNIDSININNDSDADNLIDKLADAIQEMGNSSLVRSA